VISEDGDPLDACRLEFGPVRAEGREFATAAGTGGLVPGEGSLYKDIGVFSGNIKMKGSVERTLEARFFERIDELTIEFTELLDEVKKDTC
jgi:hypothetical protein